MRRWLDAILPVVALALLVQVLAPVGAFRAVAVAASDPLASAVICSGLHDPADPAPADAVDRQCCAFCAAAGGAAAVLDPPAANLVALQRPAHRMVWRHHVEAPAPLRIGSNTQARGPPVSS